MRGGGGVSNKYCLLPFLIFTVIHLSSADSRRVVVSYKRKYVHEVLVNCLVKVVQEKVWLGELTIPT